MTSKTTSRPGGRSARVQASVHGAVESLLERVERDTLTIPAIAEEAGVTPSTIYRRWGDLQGLLADVAVRRFRPETPPLDTGTGRGDLEAWVEQYADEMSSSVGRTMIRDVLAVSADDKASRCRGYTCDQVELIATRAQKRGEAFPGTDDVLDHVIAPITYRILFDQPVGEEVWRPLVARVFENANDPDPVT